MADEVKGGVKTKFDVAEAYRLRLEGQSLPKLAAHFGVSTTAIWKRLRKYKPDVQPVPAPAATPAVERVEHTPKELAEIEADFWKGIRVFEEHQGAKFDVTSRLSDDGTLRFWRLGSDDEPELVAVDCIVRGAKVIPKDSPIYQRAVEALKEKSHDRTQRFTG
jgi:hypothetical protein